MKSRVVLPLLTLLTLWSGSAPLCIATPHEQSHTSDQAVRASVFLPMHNKLPLTNAGHTKRKKFYFALSLAGGGARGAAHIGVLKALEEAGLKPSFVTGCSVGAAVGALYCAGVPVSEIERMMLDGEFKKAWFPKSIPVQAALYAPRYMFATALNMKPTLGLYSGKEIGKFMNKHLPHDQRKIEQLKIPFAAMTTDVLDSQPVWMREGSIAEAVQASCACPFLYRPLKNKEGRLLIDGGLRHNTPADMTESLTDAPIIAVKCYSKLETKPEDKYKNPLKYADRMISILMSEIEARNVESSEMVIEPEMQNVQTYAFEHDKVKEAIDAGEAAAREMLPQIKAKLLEKEPKQAASLK